MIYINNIVYIKHFDNGKKYIGITNNFKRRMYEHIKSAYKNNSKLPVHNAMRKYNHTTEIVFMSNCYDDVLKMEKIIIKNFKDIGIDLYNITDGGEGSLGLKVSNETKLKISNSLKGNNNPRSRTKEHYAITPTMRNNFKTTCKRMGWDFNYFIEVYSGQNSHEHKKYYYIEKFM